jgi:hypothetical protein
MTFLNRYTGVVLKKQDISAYPFEEFAEATLEELEDVAERQKIPQYNSWMMPQLVAKFGQFKPIYVNTKIDAAQTLMHNLGSDPKLRGMYLVATKLPRGKLIQKQNSPQGAHYGALVPLVMAGMKKYQNIPYSHWNREDIRYVVDKNLAQAMVLEDVPQLSLERLLEIRILGLLAKSGRTEGQAKNPLSTWALTGIQDTELGHLPKLAVTMLTQIWLAHPSIRNEYMILDPINWDSMPEPLVAREIFIDPKVLATTTKATKVVKNNDDNLPWFA